MANTETIIALIAEAREKRAEQKANLANQGLACLSVTLNIPGYPKVSKLNNRFLKVMIREVKNYLLAHRILINEEQEQVIEDEAGKYYLVPFKEKQIDLFWAKELCEQFEQKHQVGRIVDIDITDKLNQPISSGKAKPCMLCKKKSAIVCMREQNHTIDELREYIHSETSMYLLKIEKEEICRRLASNALKSILYEVSLTPKPGLVNKLDSGIHKDMDYYTFLDSSSVISTFFYEIAAKGWEYTGNLSEALPQIRELGLEMEHEMFKATASVNTQKGIVFLLGLSLFSTAYAFANKKKFAEIQSVIQKVSEPLTQELNSNIEGSKTHGEICREKYGAENGGGVRQEAILGLPVVFECGLPQLDKLDNNKRLKDKKLTAALLAIMSENKDTNVLFRSNLETLQKLQEQSAAALEDILMNNNFTKYFDLIEYCKWKKISPGGSADLLAVSIFFFYANQLYLNYD